MEPSENLHDLIVRNGCLDERQAGYFFRQIVHAAVHCHRIGVVHRDFKVFLIFIFRKYDANLLDFRKNFQLFFPIFQKFSTCQHFSIFQLSHFSQLFRHFSIFKKFLIFKNFSPKFSPFLAEKYRRQR